MTDGVGEVYGLVDGFELMDLERVPGSWAPESCSPVNHVVLYDCDEYGSSMTVGLTGDPALARSFVGRRVRVTVEVIDG